MDSLSPKKRSESGQIETKSPSKQKLSIQDIPRVLLCLILSFLDKIDDRAAVELTCRTLNQCAKHKSSWPKQLHLEFDVASASSLVRKVNHLAAKVSGVRFTSIRIEDKETAEDRDQETERVEKEGKLTIACERLLENVHVKELTLDSHCVDNHKILTGMKHKADVEYLDLDTTPNVLQSALEAQLSQIFQQFLSVRTLKLPFFRYESQGKNSTPIQCAFMINAYI
jgi:hypothetical protein